MLEKVNYPADIRSFSIEELKALCAEIRQYMVECCSVNPGHLGSSLGAVEIITALHYVYNTPKDKIVFDVGHQAYAHKILTGRKEAFRKNRMKDGLSGFPNIFESEYDVFGAGHSSTSISAALGLSEAARMRGSDEKVVALIGDGALTGGLALEGLNNAGDSKSDLLVVLNDNDMSIDNNLGAIHKHLLKITSSPAYNNFKNQVWNTIGEGNFRNSVQKMVRSAKSSLVGKFGGDLFEALGFRYFGPIDGNDIEELVKILSKLRDLKGPRILHVHTVKGKGYAPAESDPTTWHAPGKFDCKTGERIRPVYKADRYQDVFGQVLIDIARKDDRVVGITPAMASGCGMTAFAETMPQRFYDVGIEEEHAVTFSAGLAAGGLRPFCNIYSSFSQRAYDEIIHDVALQKLPVVLCFDRAGLVGEDGATHHGLFDLAAYRVIPNAIVSSPKDEAELKNLMYSALESQVGPYIIRYPRGCGEGVEWKDAAPEILPVGKGECLLAPETSDVAILAIGPVVNRAMEAAKLREKDGKKLPYIYNMRFVAPIDEEILSKVAATCKTVITVEDGSVEGGLFGAVAEYISANAPSVRVIPVGVPRRFMPQDTQKAQWHECGLDAEGIASVLDSLEK